MPEPAHKRQLISTVYDPPLMTPTTALGLSMSLSMFELRETGDWDIFRGRGTIFFAHFFSQFLRNRTQKKNSLCLFFFFLFSLSLFSSSPFRPKNRNKAKNFEIGQLCPKLCLISDFAKKTRGRRPISDKIGKTEKKSGLEISRDSGPTPVARGGSVAKAPPLAVRPVPRNGRGRRLVELTNGC